MFDGVKVFAATLHRERLLLDERVTEWINESGVEVVDTVIRQSSDAAFHCLSIIVFYRNP